MDAITKQLVKKNRQAVRAEQNHAKEEKRREKKLDARRAEAVRQVEQAATRAIARTSEGSSDWWARYGLTIRACRASGPHVGFTCLLHRKTVTLIALATRSPLWLGSDGKIYRTGQTKYYRAELRRRNWPKQILKVAKVLDKLDPGEPPMSPDDTDEYY